MARLYLKVFFLLTIALITLFALFSWFANPFSIYSSPEISGFNVDKVDFIKYLRLTKARQLQIQKPTALIIGTSRAGRGLDPEYPGWKNERVYNLGLPGSSTYELLRYFQHANSISPLRKVVIALDFRCFTKITPGSGFSNARIKINMDGSENAFYFSGYIEDTIATLFSMDAFRASFKNFKQQGWLKQKFFNNGRWDRVNEQYNHQTAFVNYMKSTFVRLKAVKNEKKTLPTGVEYYQALLRIAYEENIELYIIISPSHAWHWEAYYAIGLWDEFEDMKRMLIKFNDLEASRAKKPAFSIWDFSGYNSISTEKVPINNNDQMVWFWESIHYKKILGDMILDKIFGLNLAKNVSPADFGKQISAKNLENHLYNQRKIQKKYHTQNKEIIELIERLATNP